ncbi:MAG: hypothetical protein EBT92_19220, partial [Planctomycetes bacterium]|nr:hypothetical protein [Planctomycetota bacterium]
MMKKNSMLMDLIRKPIMVSISATLLSYHVHAGTMGTTTPCLSKDCMPYFVEIGSGVSYSYPTHVKANLDIWNTSPQGYNSAMGKDALYTAGLGYTVAPWLN